MYSGAGENDFLMLMEMRGDLTWIEIARGRLAYVAG